MSALILLASCSSGPRKVEGQPPADDETRAACTKLVTALPDEVAGKQAIELANGAGWAKAWGEPAIVLRCGVAEPASFSPTSQCLTVNDIDWFASSGGAEVDPSKPPDGPIDFTTVGRSIGVEVSVPSTVSPASDALVDVSDAITKTTDETQPCQ